MHFSSNNNINASNVNPESLMKRLLNYYETFDKDLKIFEDKNMKICNNNCLSSCCSDYFYIGENEFVSILFYIKNNYGEKWLEDKVQNSKKSLREIEDIYPEEFSYLNSTKPSVSFNELNEEVLKKMYMPQFIKSPLISPCIFLNKNKECDIYPVRPLICRYYGILSYCPNTNTSLIMKNVEKYVETPAEIGYRYPILYWFSHMLDYRERNKEIFYTPFFSLTYNQFFRFKFGTN